MLLKWKYYLGFFMYVFIGLINFSMANAQSSQKGVWDARTQSSFSSSSASSNNSNNSRNMGSVVSGSNLVRQSNNTQNRGKALDYTEQIASSSGKRTCLMHIPASYDSSRPMPLVLAFHGTGMNGSSMRGLTLLDLTADQNGFIVCYPNAVGGRWNDGGRTNNNGVDDVSFVNDMLVQLSRKLNIDQKRIYACGISNGGSFCQKLACDLSNKIASIGVVSFTAQESVCSNCHIRRGMPAVFFLGTDDPLVPREGESKKLGALGEAIGVSGLGNIGITSQMAKIGGILTANEVAEFWARNNNCSAHPREERLADRSPQDSCKVTKETYNGTNEVIVYTIEGGGHTWPGGMSVVASDITGKTTLDINASDLLWQFFQNHPMR